MIIGVAGTHASGKDVVARYLAEHRGFFHISTGDIFRDYIRKNNLGDPTRDLLHVVANQVRTELGADWSVRQAMANGQRPLVVSGIRNPVEATTLKAAGGFIIAVDAPIESRFKWFAARGRVDDDVTAERFKEQEAAEFSHADPNGQRLGDVLAIADFDIANDGSLQDLHDKIDQILMRITPKEQP